MLRNAHMIIRAWTFHDDELADEWTNYRDPTEPLWNLPRQVSFSGDQWGSFFESPSQRRTWAVENNHGQLMGRISLREIDTRKAQARLGITFGAAYIGRGLGTEALALFLDYYFTELGFEMMQLDVAAPNQRAVRSYQRLGFIKVGSDWRLADSRFDRRLLNDARYAHIHQFFRVGQHGVYVEFFEMQLPKATWFAHDWHDRSH